VCLAVCVTPWLSEREGTQHQCADGRGVTAHSARRLPTAQSQTRSQSQSRVGSWWFVAYTPTEMGQAPAKSSLRPRFTPMGTWMDSASLLQIKGVRGTGIRTHRANLV